MSQIDRVDVLGVQVSAVNMLTALAEIERWIDDCERHYVCVTGVHGVMESQADSDLLEIHNQSGLTTPDGMPMVWAGRKAGALQMGRVYGPDLMLALCELSVERGWSHFFYGGRDGVPELLKEKLQGQFPGLQVVGTYSPPFRILTDDEVGDVAGMINSSDAHFVWVGLSTPKQERWMARFRPRLTATGLLGVGAAFDMHAGLLPQAPAWMQDRGLEWLYRLVKEPKRLWRRYLGNNPRYLVRIWRRPPRLLSRSEMPPNADRDARNRKRAVSVEEPASLNQSE